MTPWHQRPAIEAVAYAEGIATLSMILFIALPLPAIVQGVVGLRNPACWTLELGAIGSSIAAQGSVDGQALLHFAEKIGLVVRRQPLPGVVQKWDANHDHVAVVAIVCERLGADSIDLVKELVLMAIAIREHEERPINTIMATIANADAQPRRKTLNAEGVAEIADGAVSLVPPNAAIVVTVIAHAKLHDFEHGLSTPRLVQCVLGEVPTGLLHKANFIQPHDIIIPLLARTFPCEIAFPEPARKLVLPRHVRTIPFPQLEPVFGISICSMLVALVEAFQIVVAAISQALWTCVGAAVGPWATALWMVYKLIAFQADTAYVIVVRPIRISLLMPRTFVFFGNK
jgi:hypothetical protein